MHVPEGKKSKDKQDKVNSWLSGKRLAAGAYYCKSAYYAAGAYYGTCPVPHNPVSAYLGGKDGTDGTIEDEADALFGIASCEDID